MARMARIVTRLTHELATTPRPIKIKLTPDTVVATRGKDALVDDNCYVEPAQKIVTDEERQKVEMALLTVWGMGCPNCAARVRNSLLSLRGVVDVCVDHTVGIAGVV